MKYLLVLSLFAFLPTAFAANKKAANISPPAKTEKAILPPAASGAPKNFSVRSLA